MLELVFGGVGAVAAGITIVEKLKAYRIRKALMGEQDELWTFRPAAPPEGLQRKLNDSLTRIVIVVNSKGGVGKTTLTSNMAAYFDIRMGKRVLVIDCDYQGSISNILLAVCGMTEVDSRMEILLSENVDANAWRAAITKLPAPLQRTSLVTANATLNREENRASMQWVFQGGDDIRYRLAKALLRHNALKFRPDDEGYDIILIDAPPRLSTATLNGICASTDFIVPTALTPVSAATVSLFFTQMRRLKSDLNPSLRLAGVVPTLTTPSAALSADERRLLDTTLRDALKKWPDDPYIFERSIPRRAALAGSELGQLAIDKGGDAQVSTRKVLEDFCQELANRIRLP